jgi:glycosyltransferase involved in cell wall biosynthesis
VTALGRLDRARMHDLLVAADIVVHPSTYPEGLPSVLLEAAAAGAAIVATAAGGTTDLVRDGETGLIVPPGDPRRLARALELLASDDALRERLAAAARARVSSRFRWRLVADLLERELLAFDDRPPVAVATAGVHGVTLTDQAFAEMEKGL